MRVAAIDIGTNSTRLLVAETDGATITEEIYRETIITRLGRGVHIAGRLEPQAIERTLAALRRFAAAVREHEVDSIKAIATSAVRDCDNAQDLLAPALELLTTAPQIITGETEGALTYRGVLSDAATKKLGSVYFIVDIGGGSTEIIVGDKAEPSLVKSLPIGCVRLTEAFLSDDPPPKTAIADLTERVDRILASEFSLDAARSAVPLAVAGTATTLTSIELGLIKYDRNRVHGYRLGRDTVERLLSRLSAQPQAGREKIVGLEPARADVIVAGASILLAIMDFFDFDHVLVSERDILDGLALS